MLRLTFPLLPMVRAGQAVLVAHLDNRGRRVSLVNLVKVEEPAVRAEPGVPVDRPRALVAVEVLGPRAVALAEPAELAAKATGKLPPLAVKS